MPEKNCDKWHEDNKKKENTRKEENAQIKFSKVNLLVKSFDNLKRGNETELVQLYYKKKETPSDIKTTLH